MPSSKDLTLSVLVLALIIGGSFFFMYKRSEGLKTQLATSQLTGRTFVSFNGVGFNYDSLAQTVTGEVVPAQPYSEPQPGGSGNPNYIRFIFDHENNEDFYPPTGRYLLVYPTEGYQHFLQQNDFPSDWSPTTLQQLLTEEPASPSAIPIAPVPNASQVFCAQIEYLNFTGGKGVRFVTSYAQDVSPITNQNLIYTFQGLTNDGKYWVSFFYPVTTPLLPDTYEDAKITNYNTFARTYENYLATTTAKLNAAGTSNFKPDLYDLDDVIKTLTITNQIQLN